MYTIIILLLGIIPTQDTSHHLMPGLKQKVSIQTDQWGVSHIYAQNEQDLFFTQGFSAARDRLFQYECWRRQATGTTAEILGQRELNRDIGARLFKFRGNIIQEMNHYHPRGALIITSFVKGINAYIKLVLNGQEKLPIEFQWLGIKPGYWTPEVVISRHNGLLGNVQKELQLARWIHQIGKDRVAALMNFHPHQPDLTMDPLLSEAALQEDILGLYNAYRRPILFAKEDLSGAIFDPKKWNPPLHSPVSAMYNQQEGSNNWVINGSKSQSGHPMMANDPHRAIVVPSLRYLTHLHAPGWNVIGGGEPVLPGISIGHNEYGAWGLTIFETDIEDLIVYNINPQNSNQYWHQNKWLTFKKIKDTIAVKGLQDHVVTHLYTIDGPVPFIDHKRKLAYAVRCAWLDIGGAPYLASLRMNQAKSWVEFKNACKYAFVPAENMVWADRNGHIGWQTVGLAPIRTFHSGMVPVMNQVKNEWAGYLPILKRPGSFNPPNGMIVTANENLTPIAYPYLNTIGYGWADSYRGSRAREVLAAKNKLNVEDFQALQTDYVSLPARDLIPMLLNIKFDHPEAESYKLALSQWDQSLMASSGMAGLYVWFERYLEEEILNLYLPENFDGRLDNDLAIVSISTEWMIKQLQSNHFIQVLNKIYYREDILKASFIRAIDKMKNLFGHQSTYWKYGDDRFKHIVIHHPLYKIMNDFQRKLVNIRSAPRGGNSNTVGSTGDLDNQASGASFRIVVDCADWDLAKASNTPGQSANPLSTHYQDLFDLWAKDQYFPLYYSKEKVDRVTEKVMILRSK